MQVPSASNTAGTLLGTMAGGLVASSAASWPFIVAGAAFLGVTPMALAGALGIGATALVNYAATHYAEVKNLNELVKNWWPQIQYTYPGDKTQPVAEGPDNSNINKG